MLPQPIPLGDVEPALLARRPDLAGRPVTPWHLIARALGPGEAFATLPRDEQVRRVVDVICAIER